MTASLYGDLLAAGVPMDSHESDLYFPDTSQTREILARFPYSAKIARRFIDRIDNEIWWDVPFAFLPWWEKRTVFADGLIEPADLRDEV